MLHLLKWLVIPTVKREVAMLHEHALSNERWINGYWRTRDPRPAVLVWSREVFFHTFPLNAHRTNKAQAEVLVYRKRIDRPDRRPRLAGTALDREVQGDQGRIRPVKQTCWHAVMLHHEVPFPVVLRAEVGRKRPRLPHEFISEFVVCLGERVPSGTAAIQAGEELESYIPHTAKPDPRVLISISKLV